MKVFSARKQIVAKRLAALKLGFNLPIIFFFFFCFNDSPSKMMKDKVNFEIYDVTAWLTKNYNTHIGQ